MKSFPFLHPLLFAIYPALFLYSKNIHEYIEPALAAPLFISLVFGLIVLFITKRIYRRIEKAAIVASAFIFLSLSYARFLAYAQSWQISFGSYTIASEQIVFVIVAVAFSFVIFAVAGYKKNLISINKFLVGLSLLLVAFTLYNIAVFETKTGRIWKTIQDIQIVQNRQYSSGSKNYPDIYYFIFDRYAGPKSLQNEYGVDNREFLDFLENKGFYLAEKSTANYPKTFLSLGSSLNMEYLDYLTEQTNGGATPDESIVTPLIRNSKVLRFLKNKGYYIVNIGPKIWTPTSENPYADRNFIMRSGTYPYADAFTTGFLNTTIAAPLLEQIFQNPLDVSKDPNNNEHRRLVLYELGAVEDAIRIPGPKFVFAHILFPHDPFVFDENCTPIPESVVDTKDHVTNYVNQLKCANTRIEKLLANILTKSENAPIIILQSDEGPFPMKSPISDNQSWSTAPNESLQEKFPNLNAYYFPGATTSVLYESITPVNSFRVVFNTYFGTSYPLLPDRNYIFQDQDNLYKFIDVTDRVRPVLR